MSKNQFSDGIRRVLGQRKSVKLSISAMLAVAVFAGAIVFVGAYYSKLERELLADMNERGAFQINAGVAALGETASHLRLIEGRLKIHRDGAAPLRLLEERLDPEVGYSRISVDYTIPQLKLSVHAPNAGSIARLQVAFENDPSVLRVSLSPLSRSRESTRYEADMTITLDDAILLAFPNLQES